MNAGYPRPTRKTSAMRSSSWTRAAAHGGVLMRHLSEAKKIMNMATEGLAA